MKMKKIFYTARSVSLMATVLSMFFVMVAGVSAAPFVLQDVQAVEPQKKSVINEVAPQFSGMEKIILNRGEKTVFSGKSLGKPLKRVEAQASKTGLIQDVLAKINANKKTPMPYLKRLEAEKAKIGLQ